MAGLVNFFNKLSFGCPQLGGFQTFTRQAAQTFLEQAQGEISFCGRGLQKGFQEQFARFSAGKVRIQ